MWQQFDLTQNQYLTFMGIIESFNINYEKNVAIRNAVPPVLIIGRTIPLAGPIHRLAFSPNAFELMSHIDLSLSVYQAIPIEQPENIGRIDGWGMVMGDTTFFNSIKAPDDPSLPNPS
jgi:hypothetical protein